MASSCHRIPKKLKVLGKLELGFHVIAGSSLFILSFFTVIAVMMMILDNFDPLAPQREAAMFYGLFLRGHSAETLRRDIDVPKPMLDKWLKTQRYETNFRITLRRIYTYRKQVLAIFDELVMNEKNHRPRVH